MAKSIKKNFLYNLAFQIVSICLPIVLAPYLARVLGAEKVGISAFTLSVVEYFILLANLGISSFGQREVAMYQDNRAKYSKIFWDLIVYRVIIGSISLIAYGFFVLTATQYQAIYAILVINLLGNIFDVTWLFQGLEEYKYLSVRNIIIKIAFTILVFILVKTPADLNLYVFLNGLSILVSAAAVWIKIPSTIDKIELKKVRPLRYTKDTFIFFLPQIATMVYTVLDRTMLGLFDTTQIENGYYEQAYKIVFVATTAIISMNVVMSPRMSFLYKKGKIAELKTRLRKSLRFSLFAAVPVTFGIMAVASSFVPWFFGEGYDRVAEILPYFSSIILIIALSNCIANQCLTPCGMRGKSAAALWVCAGLNVICNLILIPKMMCMGAVIGSIVAEFSITVSFFYLAKDYVNALTTFKDSIKYFIAAIVMYFSVCFIKQFLPNTIPATIIESMIGATIYGVLLLVLRDKLVFDYITYYKNKLFKK